jgi:beta-glucosidase
MEPGHFPDDFVWGAATASYQIEGAVHEDGRGESVWDRFSHTPGRTHNGDTGDVACDHYHRWPEDVKLMQELGLQAYRFSIAWPRVLPQGWGQSNPLGLDFYDSLVDALLAANITPYVTLFHWDLPQALQDRGGWANRDTVDAFVEYAEAVVQRLGDRVTHWITHNEPQVYANHGHFTGEHAPGTTDHRVALQVAHNLLLSHGRVVPLLRSARDGAQVGITLNLSPSVAASESEADQRAAAIYDGLHNRWFLDPLYGRGYPQEIVEALGDAMPEVQDGDLDIAAAQTDFLGINYYFPQYVRAASADESPLGFAALGPDELRQRGHTLTAMGWPIVRDGLRDLLVRVHRDYAPREIFITENGAAFDDEVRDGVVDDQNRIAYLREHFNAASEAIGEGVPLHGYFVWSLMDNFEWAHGFSKRFGLIYVDYATQERIPKASADWYRRVIEEDAVPADE